MFYFWIRDSGVARQGLSWGCSQMLAGLSSFEGSTKDGGSTPCGSTCGCQLWVGKHHPSSHGPLHRAAWVSSHMIAHFLRIKHSRKQDWSCIAFYDLTKEITCCYFCHFLLVTVVSRIMIPQRCPKTVELVTVIFHGKWEFTGVVKLAFWDG